MGFFDRPVSPPPAPEPEVPRPAWIRPEAVFPGMVDVHRLLVHTEGAAIAVTELLAYPAGFAFTVTAELRSPDRSPDRAFHGWHGVGYSGDRSLPAEFLRVGVLFADGSSITNLDRHAIPSLDVEPDGPVLVPEGGEADPRRSTFHYWVWPLPPPGPLAFVCEWPGYGVPETRMEVDGQLILDAAAHAVPLWPENDADD